MVSNPFAPEIYLAVFPITRETNGSLCLGGVGAVIDCLVKMRRLPVDQTLEALVRGELRRNTLIGWQTCWPVLPLPHTTLDDA